MGKASSAKKVARAARAGGSRRPGQRRALGFPIVVTSVIVIGVSLVVFARSSRDANAEPQSSAAGEDADHWHAAYGFNYCGEWVHSEEGDFLVDVGQDALGIHTHGDGVIHIHPFLDSAAGRDAKMQIFLDQIQLEVSDDVLTFPGEDDSWDEGEDTCTVDGEEVPGQIVLARWNDAQDAADGEKPTEVLTEDFGDSRFRQDREYYTFAFVPEDDFENIPVRPDVIDSLNNLSDVIDAPDNSTSSTVEGEGGSSTTAGDGATSTTVAGDSTTTSAPADASTTTATTAG